MTTQLKKAIATNITWFAASVFVASVNAGEAGSEPSVSGYQMAAITDLARGSAIMAGEYEKAIDGLDTGGFKRFEASTNLCVAFTMTGELDKADQECAIALQLSEKSETRRDIAVALSNLGVVKAVSGDITEAQRNFGLALEINADLSQASENLRRLRDADVSGS